MVLVPLFIAILLFHSPAVQPLNVSAAILCETCKLLSQEILYNVEAIKLSKGAISEEAIWQILDEICLVDKKSGQWIMHYDIKKSTNKLELVLASNGELPGECGTECQHMASTCQKILDAPEDALDIVIAIYRGVFSEDVLCLELTSSCKNHADASFDVSDYDDQPFKQMSAKDYQFFNLKNNMRFPNSRQIIINPDGNEVEQSETHSWLFNSFMALVKRFEWDRSSIGGKVVDAAIRVDGLMTGAGQTVMRHLNSEPNRQVYRMTVKNAQKAKEMAIKFYLEHLQPRVNHTVSYFSARLKGVYTDAVNALWK